MACFWMKFNTAPPFFKAPSLRAVAPSAPDSSSQYRFTLISLSPRTLLGTVRVGREPISTRRLRPIAYERLGGRHIPDLRGRRHLGGHHVRGGQLGVTLRSQGGEGEPRKPRQREEVKRSQRAYVYTHIHIYVYCIYISSINPKVKIYIYMYLWTSGSGAKARSSHAFCAVLKISAQFFSIEFQGRVGQDDVVQVAWIPESHSDCMES